MALAPITTMRPIVRKLTLQGIGIDASSQHDEAVPSSRGVTCRPAVVATTETPARYSFVAPRRSTLTMPLPSGDHAASRRRPTAMMPSLVDEAARHANAS